MRLFIVACAWLAFCSTALFPRAQDCPDSADRPFIDTETIDVDLLRSQLNIALENVLWDRDVELVHDPRIERAADIVLRHPEGVDSTDENGCRIDYERTAVEREGYPCGFVMKVGVSSKTNCGSVRNFDDSDTYASVASRCAARMMEGNSDLIQRSGFTGYGIGILLTEEYPELINGRILTDEPKDQWIHLLFFITL